MLLALSSAFIFGAEHRGYFYRGGAHTEISAKNLAIAENLSPEHHFLMFHGSKSIDTDGRQLLYKPYNRFPIGAYALIKLAILPFGGDLSRQNLRRPNGDALLFFAAAAVLWRICHCAASLRKPLDRADGNAAGVLVYSILPVLQRRNFQRNRR